ncbi:MAG: DUF541 domain-containing protein [Clostridiales bacterium]|nr:DUF541 domain-containing protein [Clostridiales bacterium]
MGVIKVKGLGSVKVKPDIIEFNLNFNVRDKKYDIAVDNEVKNVNKLYDILDENNIDKEKFKTINYSVRPYYVTKEIGIVEKKTERVFAGYEVVRTASLEIALDLKQMEKLIYNCENLGIKTTYNFSVLDKESAKKEAMKKAYNNAYEKAMLLAEVSGVELNGYEEISYEVPYTYNTYSRTGIMAKEKGLSIESSFSLAETFNIDDIEFQENIYVVWNVK